MGLNAVLQCIHIFSYIIYMYMHAHTHVYIYIENDNPTFFFCQTALTMFFWSLRL